MDKDINTKLYKWLEEWLEMRSKGEGYGINPAMIATWLDDLAERITQGKTNG